MNAKNTNIGVPLKRIRWIFAFILIIVLVFVARLFQIQGVDSAGLANRAVAERMSEQVVFASRGDILDTNNRVLATNVPRYNISAIPKSVAPFTRIDSEKNRSQISVDTANKEIAEILDMQTEQLTKIFEQGGEFAYVKKMVSPEIRTQIVDLKIPWITSELTHARMYPGGNLGGSILGFMGNTGPEGDTALAGMELAYDESLRGVDGRRIFEMGADGVRIPSTTTKDVPVKESLSIKSTLDSYIQFVAQQAAENVAKEYNAEWANIVVMEVGTSKVLAMGESVSVDSNNPTQVGESDRGTRSVAEVFEPGSTSKIITTAAVLEEGIATPESRFSVPDRYSIGNELFKDSNDHGGKNLTLTGILSESSNTGTLMVGKMLDREKRYEYLKKFGLGSSTNLGLPGESAGILGSAQSWDNRQQYTVLFGQGISVTALQSANVFNTMANNGVLVKPRLIDSYIDADGNETTEGLDIDPGTQAVSPETAKQVMRMLESVVEKGSGKKAAIPGYRVGGKTGTAEAFAEGIGYEGYTASFVGVAPAENPKYTVAITVQRPLSDKWGETVAAPIFSHVMGEVLKVNGVPPSTEKEPLYDTSF